MTQISKLSITNFKNGAIIDRLERALSETINHISDPETGLEAREIVLSIKIKPSDDRDEAEIIVRCETKLKNPVIEESISIDRDINGKPVAYEVMRQAGLPIGGFATAGIVEPSVDGYNRLLHNDMVIPGKKPFRSNQV